MDRATVIGILLIIAGVGGGQLLEGGSLYSLVQPAAFFIVVIGTAGAVILQSSVSQALAAVKLASWVFVSPHQNRTELVNLLTNWSSIARKDGVLLLEKHIPTAPNDFSKRALRLLVDGTTPDRIASILEANIDLKESHYRSVVRVWESAGGYAPTIGILGAVLGLIHVMENLGDPTKLGSGIAIAFVATVYGVGLANLFFIPIATKLKSLVAYEIETEEMLTVGFISIANSENPRLITDRCGEYLKN